MTLAFERYYRTLSRRNRSAVNADDARRDFQDALRTQVDAMLYVR